MTVRQLRKILLKAPQNAVVICWTEDETRLITKWLKAVLYTWSEAACAGFEAAMKRNPKQKFIELA